MSARVLDLTGLRFGRLIVQGLVDNPNSKRGKIWKCLCDCGNTVLLDTYSLTTGNTKSCGCYQRDQRFVRPFEDLSGKQFGKWTVLYPLPKGPYESKRYYRCKCNCGTERNVATGDLRNGKSLSCGCDKKEIGARRRVDLTGRRIGKLTVVKPAPDIHTGDHVLSMWFCQCDCGNVRVYATQDLTAENFKSCGDCHHVKGFTHHPLYKRWASMISRCYCKSSVAYPNYGGRGIKVCDEWRTNFQTFYKWALENGFSPELTIDRIDVNGNYEPSNCRWVSMDVQRNNKTTTRFVTIDDVTQSLTQWACSIGKTYDNLRNKTNEQVARLVRRHQRDEELGPFVDKLIANIRVE